MKIAFLQYINIIIILLFITSCTLNYNTTSQKAITALTYNKNFVFNTNKLKNTNNNYLLINQEAGLFNFLKNNLDISIDYFSNAVGHYRQIEEASKVNFKNALSFTVLSDTLTNYAGSDFELSLVHYYKGLAYLAKSDLQKSYIEFKAVELTQKFSEQVRQKKIIASESKIEAFLNQYSLTSNNLQEALQQSEELRARTRSNFLNANNLYLAGIVRELNKSYNDALISYKQAYSIQPNNTYLLEDLYRLSLIYDRDYAIHLEKVHSHLNKLSFKDYNKANSVYLIYEQGYIPQKENLKIPLFGTGNNNLILTINLPVYNYTTIPNKEVKLLISNPSNFSTQAEDIVNIYKLAKNNLIENYPLIISRQISKVITQVAIQKSLQAKNTMNNFSLLAGSLYLLDSSDIRSWRTLPSLVKIAKINTNTSIKQISVIINNEPYTLDLSLNNGEIAIIYVFDTGYHVYTKVLYKNKK